LSTRSAPRRKRQASKPEVLLLRNSERSTYKKCEQMWYWNFVELLKPIEEGRALRFGDLVHRALEGHYLVGTKRGPKPHIVFEKLYQEQLQEGRDRLNMVAEDQGWVDAGELGVAMLRGYYDEFSNTDAQYEVLASEQVFQVPLPLRKEQRILIRQMTGKIAPKVLVVGTMDGLWRPRIGTRSSRLPFIKEYKTSGSNVQEVIRAIPMDEQAGTYWTFGPIWMWKVGILPKGVYPSHILYTILRKQKPDERPEDSEGRKLNKPTKGVLTDEWKRRFKRKPLPKGSTVDSLIAALGPSSLQLGEVSQKQPAPLFARQAGYRDAVERAAMWRRCQDEATRLILARAGVTGFEIIKNPGPQYRSNCAQCAFRDPCEVHETGGDFESVLRALYHKWTPYSAHELPERW
jgi:hypothetical protein